MSVYWNKEKTETHRDIPFTFGGLDGLGCGLWVALGLFLNPLRHFWDRRGCYPDYSRQVGCAMKCVLVLAFALPCVTIHGSDTEFRALHARMHVPDVPDSCLPLTRTRIFHSRNVHSTLCMAVPCTLSFSPRMSEAEPFHPYFLLLVPTELLTRTERLDHRSPTANTRQVEGDQTREVDYAPCQRASHTG